MKTGASLNLRLMPDSQPNDSHTVELVVSGTTVAARTDAPNRPMAKSTSANSPATGTSACAASSAVSMVTPLPYSVAAVTTTMKTASVLVQTAPSTASARPSWSSSGPSPLSATEDCR